MNKENIHVLVIDDNADLLVMLKAMFEFTGYRVSVKGSADKVEEFIHKLSPDIILMDMLLSGTDACLLCVRIKSSKAIAAIPVIMISAMPEAQERCLSAGADYFIDKPFEMDHLLNTVKNLTANKTIEQQNVLM